MTDPAVCFYTVVRYVAAPRRDEARNIGILLVCPDRGFAGSRFSLRRAGVAEATPRYRMLRELERTYRAEMPGETQAGLFGPPPKQWRRDDLEALHGECSNLIQFTQPLPYMGEPADVLEKLYQEFVRPRSSGWRAVWTRGRAIRTFETVFAQYHVREWLHETPPVQTAGGTFDFDLGIGNGHWRYIIETLSFRNEDLLRVERAGAWFAKVWPAVGEATGAHGMLLVEPPEDRQDARERYERVRGWSREAEIEIHTSDETAELATNIAKELRQPVAAGSEPR